MNKHPPPPYSIDESIRHRLSSEQYLSKYDVKFYLNDIICLITASRCERPLDTVAKYFHDASRGLHVVGRDFKFIKSTPRNRISFTSFFENIYSDVNHLKVFSSDEFYQLIHMVCSDFPSELSHQIYRNLFFQFERRPTFKELNVGFKIFFFFKEFFEYVSVNIFGHDNKKKIETKKILGVLKKYCDEHLKKKLREDRNSFKVKTIPCVPAYEFLCKLVSKYDEIDFGTFSSIFYDAMNSNTYKKMINCLDLRVSPISGPMLMNMHNRQKSVVADISGLQFKKKMMGRMI